MKILVTGASGFLGLNILRQLSISRPEATIVAADLHAPSAEDLSALGRASRSIIFESLDVRDQGACLRLVAEVGTTHVIHAAAVTCSESAAIADDNTRKANLTGAENILKAATAAKLVQRCLLLSSSGVYSQRGGNVSCDEEDPLQLDNEYASSKRAAELLMNSYETAGGFVIAAARIAPAYGPFERSRATRPHVSLIRRLTDSLLENRPLRIGGTDCERDWTHSGDIAAALDCLLFSPRLSYRVYNVGSGVGVSARKIITLFAEKGLEVCWSDDAPDIVLDPKDGRKPLVIERLQHDTGFTPRFDICTGIADAIATESGRLPVAYGNYGQRKSTR